MAFDAQFAIATIAAEASSGTDTDRDGVACVILNRKKDPRWAHQTIAEICLDYEQFSSWNGDSGDRANLLRVARAAENDSMIQKALLAWSWAKNSNIDVTNGATHYCDARLDDHPPAWTVGAVLTLKTDVLRFYRGVK